MANETNVTELQSTAPGAEVGFGFVTVIPGILANVFAIFFFSKASKKTGLAVHCLLLALAITDLLGCLLACYTAATAYTGDIQNRIACNILMFITSLCPMATAVVACLLAIDRYLALCHPFKYQSSMSQRKAKMAICLSLSASCFISMLPFVKLGNYFIEETNEDGEKVYVCSALRYQPFPHQRVYGVLYGGVGLAIIAIVIFANTMVVKTVWTMRRTVISTPTDISLQDQACEQMSVELKFVRMVIGISLTLLFCWTPFMILVLLVHVGYDFPTSQISSIMILASLNFIIDPYVHIFSRRSYRQAIKKILFCRCCGKSENSIATSSAVS